MDTKVLGMSLSLFNDALCIGRRGYLDIIDIMNLSIKENRKLKIFTIRFKIDINKIKNVIGKGGSVIKELIGCTKASIDIEQDGLVTIKSKDESVCLLLQKSIEDIILGPCIDKIYSGSIVKIVNFGLFVSIIPGYIGLIHITSLKGFFVNNEEIYDLFSIKQLLQVKVVGFDGNKIKLLLIST
jgi:polyribonucleotide nucleotidyltransferase